MWILERFLGIWEDRHIQPLARVADFIQRMGWHGGAGATISCLPSVLTSIGVSGSILRRDREWADL